MSNNIPQMGGSIPVDSTDLMTTPLFSVIIPLEYHRGQWERSGRPAGFPEQEKLLALPGPRDRLEHSTERHDIGLCAVGAARARGQFLFFTESHCWPEPDVLERCARAFTAHPEWSAFSCQSIRITHNRLSSAEADMYEADIEHGMTNHRWRKVLDQCFVTRRDVYAQCGLKSEVGHFAEWVLAANYSEFGHKIGYVPEARLHHYYIGELAELRSFTRDFVTGEMRYFAKETQDPGRHLLEVPPEWTCQGSWDRHLARSLLRIAMHDMLAPSASRPRRPRMFARTFTRWLTPAIVGEGAARAAAAAKICWAFAVAKLVSFVGSKAQLSIAFKNYVAALIDHQRLECIKSERRALAETAGHPHGDYTVGWSVFAPGNAGFYPIEISDETKFRWSETAAIMPAWIPKGRHRVCIECLPVRPLLQGADLRFYFNEQPLSDRDISIGPDSIEIRLDLPQSRHSTLAWTCLPFPATDDRRWLGLPVKRIVWSPAPSAATTAVNAEG